MWITVKYFFRGYELSWFYDNGHVRGHLKLLIFKTETHNY